MYRCSQERLTLLKDVARKVGEGSPYREAAPPLGARFSVPVGQKGDSIDEKAGRAR